MTPATIRPTDARGLRQLRGCLAAGLLAVAAAAAAAAPAPPTAAAGPLATVTIATRSLAETRLFYETGLGLTLRGPMPLTEPTRRSLAKLWHLPADASWSHYVLERTGIEDAARLRVLVFDRPSEPWRRDWNPTVVGPYSIGFPVLDQPQLDATLRELGFGARNAMERTPFTHPDGRQWEIVETVHTAPDFVAAVGIARGGGNAPIAAVDASGRGGPAYSMMVVEDVERMAAFVRDVLAYDIRIRRVQQSSGLRGALRTPDGTEFELAQLSPGNGSHGFLILIQFRNLATTSPAQPPRLPASGLTLYSFPVERLEPVLERAARAGATQVTGPVTVDNPPHGTTRHATFLAPNGVMFELFERPVR